MGLNNYNFHLYTCGFKHEGYSPTSFIIAALDMPDQINFVCTLVARELGFRDEPEYVMSLPNGVQYDNPDLYNVDDMKIWVHCWDERGASKVLKHILDRDFERFGGPQFLSTPKMSGVTLCTHFKNVGYNNLWYCSDWEG